MRKIVLSAAIAVTALTFTACSQNADDPANAPVDNAISEPEADASVDDASNTQAGTVLDANSATAEQLANADGVSPTLAEAIVAGKPYATVVDLNVRLRETLSQEEAAAVLANVFVPVDLNSASRKEIELIPGMSDRMVGEFLEYRPYEGMNEFNREIGKYVDETEVARFRNYVTL